MKYQHKFVLRVNEIYHDIEEKEYETKHPYIFKHEAKRWIHLSKQYLSKRQKSQTILDLGCGTGFVPLQISDVLKKDDLFICADISEKMVQICKNNIMNSKFNCKFKFLKLTGKEIPLKNASTDAITMNSVLHHIPNLEQFFFEINRVLKKQGVLVIGHEPNKAFYTDTLLWRNYQIMTLLTNPLKTIAGIMRHLKIIDFARRIYAIGSKEIKKHNQIINKLNNQLRKEGLIKKPLSSAQITEIVDINSPTAGGYHKNKGIDCNNLIKKYIPNFRLIYFETYNHLNDVSEKNKITRKYSKFLKNKFPKKGATMFAIFQKIR